MADPATTLPGSITVLAGETLPVSIDFALRVATGQIPASPTSELFDITQASPGTSFPGGLSGSPSLSGTVVAQTLTGLTAGHRYRLILGMTVAATVLQDAVTVECPY